MEKYYWEEIFKEYKDVVSPKDLQKMLGLGETKVYKMLKNQEIYSRKVGNNYLIPKVCVIDFLLKD